MAKKCWIGGNFKAAANSKTVEAVIDLLNNVPEFPKNVEVVIAPSALHIERVLNRVRKDVAVAIQDVHTESKLGAYTGSHTIDQVKDLGLPWVLAGHSERRSIWGETSAQSATKVKNTLDAGLKAIICIGETRAEREANQTFDVVFGQLQTVVDVLTDVKYWENVVVAYEPVWAIGTGRVATIEEAQEVHSEIRKWLATKTNADAAKDIRIVYGGSVTAGNASDLIQQADIDGFLVGGASLKPDFISIIDFAKNKSY